MMAHPQFYIRVVMSVAFDLLSLEQCRFWQYFIVVAVVTYTVAWLSPGSQALLLNGSGHAHA